MDFFKGMLKGALASVEKGLLKLVDEQMSPVMKETLKKASSDFIDKNYDKYLSGLQGKVRNLIDKIDGEANLPPLPSEKTEAAAAPAAEAAPVSSSTAV